MRDSHSHNDHGDHTHGATNFGKVFAIGVSLNLIYVVVQVGFGIRANSVALLADATHNLSDVLGLLLSWGAIVLATRRPTQRFTYGLRGSSILAALVNGAVLLLVTGGIAWEAVQRLFEPAPVAGGTVIAVAALGIVVNAATAWLFQAGRRDDLNIRSAFLHMAADAVVSLGVVLAGIGIVYTNWLWLDPAVSLIVAAVIVAGTWNLLRDSVRLALDAVPEGIEIDLVRSYLAGLPGIIEVHDLHIWGMSTTDNALTVHLVMPQGHPGDSFVSNICKHLHDTFRVSHATIQVETDPDHPCALAPDHVI
jgi:cobalt-zinc-cadmium efflux system protein